ncbi:alpha-L-rhamnosidase [Compostibacter hankyongensis]|uniref:alpha-L-rhamnosidase n=1 Tax=Compostibacter hankyongensis TaxID=1007089 RepID=A0ABP8FB97_9BACT
MRHNISFCFAILFLLLGLSCGKHKTSLSVQQLRCEYREAPLGIQQAAPRLSWEITSPARGVVQQAYRILVASSPELLEKDSGDLWNSGKVESALSVGVRYAGKDLKSRTDGYWKVRVWTNKGNTAESAPAHWSVGLLHEGDWSGQWIGLDSTFAWEAPHAPHTRLAARYFRQEFAVDKKIKQARVYVSGLGTYQLFINGEKIGHAELSPAPTQYNKRAFYNTYDVTAALKSGANALGTVVGNGRFFSMRPNAVDAIPAIMDFGYPKLRLQLEITYTDGTVKQVASDTGWKATAAGPVVANSEFDGECYDATREMPGWSQPGFDDSRWLPARQVQAPEGRIVAQMNPLIKVMDTLHARTVFQIAPGKYIVDMGQNMVGWAAMKIANGKRSDTVRLHFAERLNPDSTLYTDNLRGAETTDRYVMKEGAQQWEPHFTYHGFRYIEVSGYPGTPKPDDFVGKVVYDDLPVTGHFETSNPVINEVYRNAFWGIRGNYRGIPTDCPQRDERMGWLGDRAVGSYGESFIFDNNTFYAKWLQDIADGQTDEGSLPDIAPTYWKMYTDNMTWPATYLIIADMLDRQFGNLEPVRTHYDAMKKWLDYMKDKYMSGYILGRDIYGDWCMPPRDPKLIHSTLPERITAGDYLGTAFYYRMLQLMERFAGLLHKPEDKAAFAALAGKVKAAFNEKYLHPDGSYSNNTATANILALAYDLAPDSLRQKVFGHVVQTTLHDFNGHISTGLVGGQWLMRTLTRCGRPDVAYKLATNTTYPSWGYMVKEGATTIWELWNGNTADPAMNSGNHLMLLGDLIVWFYEDLAGIRSDPEAVGFKKIIMKPIPVPGLDRVQASFHSVQGWIRSSWHSKDGTFDWQLTVPANTTARIFVPAGRMEDVTEGGKAANAAEGVRFIKMEGDRALFEVGSGTYRFVSKRS